MNVGYKLCRTSNCFEELKLCQYCLDVADMGCGLTIEDMKVTVFKLAELSGRRHLSTFITMAVQLVGTAMRDF